MISVSLFVRRMTTDGTTASARRPSACIRAGRSGGGAVGPVLVQQRVREAHARGELHFWSSECLHLHEADCELRPVLQSISFTHSVGSVRDSSKTSCSSARRSQRRTHASGSSTSRRCHPKTLLGPASLKATTRSACSSRSSVQQVTESR